MSRGGLEGARYERTTPQTVWEPGRPFQWFGLRAPLVRSTKWAFSWRPLGPQARVPLYVPYADFFQYQAGAGRLAGRA